MDAPTIPAGMVEVDKARFFALLQADRRDIMPRCAARDHSTWDVVATREAWGWSVPGYASPHGTPQRFAVVASAAAR